MAVQPDEDFTTKERKLDKDGNQLTRYTVAVQVAGWDGKPAADQLRFTVPDNDTVNNALLQAVELDSPSQLLYANDSSRNGALNAVSFRAAGIKLADPLAYAKSFANNGASVSNGATAASSSAKAEVKAS